MFTPIYDFQKSSNLRDWQIVNDGVMGGLSQGHFMIDQSGHGVFYGDVSTRNNGGFSSVRHSCSPVQVTENAVVVLTLKGDGKDYQFRIKADTRASYSYITTFSTSGDWQKVEIPLKDLYPSFRGQKLDIPNFAANSFSEIVFLIANNQAETFKLTIDKIELK